jgi:hypothetical protein
VTAQSAGYIAAVEWRQPGGDMPEAQSIKFKDMTVTQKAVFVLKVAVCIISGGFIYPHIMTD